MVRDAISKGQHTTPSCHPSHTQRSKNLDTRGTRRAKAVDRATIGGNATATEHAQLYVGESN